MGHLVRAAYLLVLAVAPRLASPDPGGTESPLAVVVSIIGILALLGSALALRRAVASPAGTVAAVLAGLAVATAVGAAIVLDGRDLPLAAGAPYVALPAWAALATAASAAAGEWLGSSWKHKRMAGAVAVLGLAAVILNNAAPTFGSVEAMWKEAARRDPGNERAVAHVATAHLEKKRYDEARRLVARCLAVRPASCTCLELAAESASRAASRDRRERGAAAVEACPDRAAPRAVLAEALGLEGNLEGALEQVEAGLARGGAPARFEHVRALAYQRAGKYPEAIAAAEKAIAAGAGRDSKLLLAALQIASNQLDLAAATLAPLARDEPNDTEVAYEVAQVADRRDDYDLARRTYLSVLRVDPQHADARHEVALLCLRHGAIDEAKQHARRFADAHPDDPRAKTLLASVGSKR